MKITKATYERLDLQLSEPYTIAYETVEHSTNFILKLETDIGLVGWGCAAPDWHVTGETPEDVIEVLEQIIIPYLEGKNPFGYARIIFDLKPLLKGKSSSLAMVDIALYDLLAKKAEVPLYQFLGGFQHSIPTSITIGIMSVGDTIRQAKEFIQQGFYILKIKGGKEVNEDIEKMKALRKDFGNKIKLRFDGNQGYSLSEAIQFVEGVKSFDLELFEQPTCMTDEALLGKVTSSVDLPVMADESLKSLKDVFRLAQNGRIDMINIKIMKVGGITEGLHINSVAKSAGLEAMVGCLDECALGIAAGLHFALSRPNIEFADLDGHFDLMGDPFHDLFSLKNGWLTPSQKSGLGL